VPVPVVRAYEELNDYLPPGHRRRGFPVELPPGATLADLLHRLGIPVEAVDLALADGEPVLSGSRLGTVSRVALYPVFERFDIAALAPSPRRRSRFFADEHLARLARYLRLAGFDTLLAQGLADEELVARAEAQQRIVLTRDRGLLARHRPSRALYVVGGRPHDQLAQVIASLQLEHAARPFTRCMVCNGVLEDVGRGAIAHRVPASVARDHDTFLACSGCDRVYWPGSHVRRMRALLQGAGMAVD
jgi:uncharacterized protein with PIN domain/sulfur carrier protein ThiS